MTEAKITKLTKTWQKLLRMQDWEIVTKFAEPGELDHGTFGTAQGDYNTRRGLITLNKPALTIKAPHIDDDLELTLVHELLHLKFYSLMSEDSERDEGNIDDLASLLVSYRRQLEEFNKSEKKLTAVVKTVTKSKKSK